MNGSDRRSIFPLGALPLLGAPTARAAPDPARGAALSRSDSLSEFFGGLFSSEFMPHGHCYFWKPSLVWLHVVSDSLIAFAYYSIPLILFFLVRKRKDIPFHWVLAMFGSFIFWCGTTHVMGIWTLWDPIYRFEGAVKAITAAVSVTTAIVLVPLVPRILEFKSPEELERIIDERTRQLEERNRQLNKEVEARKRAEEQLRKQTRELERSNGELEQFAYVASHDLQEPLRMVSLYCELLQSRYQGQLGAEGDRFIHYAVDGATRMQQLILDLLDFSRVRTRFHPQRKASLEEALAEVLKNLHYAIQEAQGEVRADEKLPDVPGDPRQMTQLLQNLIGNALKYRKPDVPPRIRIGCEAENAHWKISVSDNGIGIEPEHTGRLFRVFQRLHTRGEYPGTGIGLAICKKIVENHGGRIWVESAPGKGSTFRFTLPREAA